MRTKLNVLKCMLLVIKTNVDCFVGLPKKCAFNKYFIIFFKLNC